MKLSCEISSVKWSWSCRNNSFVQGIFTKFDLKMSKESKRGTLLSPALLYSTLCFSSLCFSLVSARPYSSRLLSTLLYPSLLYATALYSTLLYSSLIAFSLSLSPSLSSLAVNQLSHSLHACISSAFIYIYICVCVCMYVCMYACMHACMYVCMSVCVSVCVCVVLQMRFEKHHHERLTFGPATTLDGLSHQSSPPQGIDWEIIKEVISIAGSCIQYKSRILNCNDFWLSFQTIYILFGRLFSRFEIHHWSIRVNGYHNLSQI